MSGDYDCGLDEACLDQDGEVRAGRHGHHEDEMSAESPTAGDDIHGLKLRVERLEHRVSDLGAFVQAAVKEMRQHATHKTCAEELADELAEFESRGSLDGWVNLNEDDEEGEAMRHLSLKALEGQWDVDELDEEPYVHVWPCKRECCG